MVTWVEKQEDATEVTTDANGSASFEGLKAGTYYLVETLAPSGYNLLTEPIEVIIAPTTAEGSAEAVYADVTSEVANSTGSLLPSTGGIGTTIFYVLGGVLVLGAAILLITKKRMSRAED